MVMVTVCTLYVVGQSCVKACFDCRLFSMLIICLKTINSVKEVNK